MQQLFRRFIPLEEPGWFRAVIARPQAVAISWYDLRIGTQYREIATSLRSSQ